MATDSAVLPMLLNRGRGRFARGLWRLADPKVSAASFSAIFLAVGAAAAQGTLAWAWLVVAAGIFAVEVAKNASGEVFDLDSGADLAVAPEDRSPFSGGKRVLVDGLLTRRQTWAIAAVGYIVALAAGLAVVAFREPRVLWLGLAGLLAAWFYNARPVALAYRGLGELAVALCYGPLLVSGTYLTLRQELTPRIVLLGVPLGLLIAAFLWVNELPDFLADQSAGKRTLVVRLGRQRAARAFSGLVAAAFFGLLALPAFGFPAPVLLGLAGLPPAVAAAARLWRLPMETRRIVPAQAQILLAFLLMALGAGLGLLWG